MKALLTFLTAGFAFMSTPVIAQFSMGKYEAGLRISGIIYQGDISPSPVGSYKSPSAGVGIFVSRILNKKFAVRANVDFGTLQDDDAHYSNPEWKQYRNFNFKTTYTDVAAHLIYNLRSSYKQYNFAPYIFGGVGVAFTKINRDASGFQSNYHGWQDWVAPGLAEDLAKTPPRLVLNFPIGIGFRRNISDHLTLFGEGSYRFTFTDYLDGFSKSADPKWRDHFSNISIGIIYRFGNSGIGCPRY